MSRARDMANLGAQAGSGLDASDITTGTLGNTVQDNITRLGVVTTGTLSHGTTLQKWVDSSNTGVTFPDGHVIQYKSINVTGNQVTGNTTFTHLSAYDLSITPQYNNSKIVLFYSGNWYINNDGRHGYFTLYRDSTHLGNTTEGLRVYMTANTGAHWQSVSVRHIDEPNTTSAITYKIYIRSQNTDAVFRINYDGNYFSNFSISEIKV